MVAGPVGPFYTCKRSAGFWATIFMVFCIISMGGMKGMPIPEAMTLWRTNLSDKTVKKYVSNILGKLEVSRRSQAAAYMAEHRVRGEQRP